MVKLNEFYKRNIEYMKPLFVGCSILELSTLNMIDFDVNIIQQQSLRKDLLIYGDTDNYFKNLFHHVNYERITKRTKI